MADQELAQTPVVKPKRHRGRRIFFWLVVFLLRAVAGLLGAPTTRYKVLNAAGVRSSTSLVIVDQSSNQPLKNVQVSVAGVSAQTDSAGQVSLQTFAAGPDAA